MNEDKRKIHFLNHTDSHPFATKIDLLLILWKPTDFIRIILVNGASTKSTTNRVPSNSVTRAIPIKMIQVQKATLK